MRYTLCVTIVFFFLLLFVLYLLSRKVTRLLSRLFMRLFHNQSTSIYLLSFIFLPGVVLHELSHLLVANLLFVPTGEVEFFPEIQGNEVKMGSVAIARTDPLRRFLIGVAPVFGGLGIMFAASAYFHNGPLSWQSVLLFYIVFQVGNTMFSSSKDMEGALGILAAAVAIGIILFFVHVPVWQAIIAFSHANVLTRIVGSVNMFLLLALGVDMFLVLLFEGLTRLRR